LIIANGGQLIRFTGDSVLAFWSDDVGGAQQALFQTTQCADAICKGALKEDSAHAATVNPSFHAGVGHGELRIAAIGGNPNWNLVADGNAVEQAVRALGRAGTGKVAFSQAANSQVEGDTAASLEHLDGSISRLVGEPSDDWLRGFLPPHTLRLLESADRNRTTDAAIGFAWDAEIRPMSVLFGRISGASKSFGNSVSDLHTLCHDIQSKLRVHDGPAGEFFFDGTGLVCLAAFGEAGAFHRDDPQRALATAKAISACASKLDLKAAIGVATGDLLRQLVGSPEHLEPMLFGQPVNRAARLMASSTGEVFCDPQTQRLARGQFEFTESGTLQLAGLGEVVPVFQPLQSQETSPHSSDMIGRSSELAFLERTYKEVSAGSKRIVAVVGEPGIGKTTLINAFATSLDASGGSLSIARAERNDRRTSLLVWRQVLYALTKVPGDGDGQGVYDAICDRLCDHAELASRLPLLSDVLSIELPDTDGTIHLSGTHRADATMRLIAGIIGELAPRPFVVILEDSQWLDSASWRLVEWVSASLESILVVLCVRVGEVPNQLRALQHRASEFELDPTSEDADLSQHFRQIQLTELDEISIRQLIKRTLEGAPARDEIEQRIMTLAGGNPLFVEEIALSLKSEGLISKRDGHWQSIRPIEKLAYFEGIEKVIRERVDQLDGITREVLTAASVIGRSFDTRSLSALLDFDINTNIHRLVDAQLVLRKARETRYEFRHDQIRDVVYNSIPTDKRQQLHKTLASLLETEYSDGTSGDITTLVQHFEAAGVHDQAVRYADIAATNALRIGAYREVEAFLSICLENEPPRSRRTPPEKLRSVRWRRQLAEAHYGRGDILAQGIAIRDALDAAGQRVPETKVSTVVRLASRGLHILARQALPFSQDHASKTDAARWDGEIARCLNQAAIVDYFQLRFARGMCNLLGAVLRSEKTGITAETVMSNCQLGAGLGMMGWRSMNSRLMSRAEQVALNLEDPSLQSHVCILDALWRLGFCEWEMVDQRLDQAQRLALTSGDQIRWCNAQGIRFWSQYYRGDLGALEKTTDMLLLRAQNAGNIQQEIWALRCKALCLLHIERPREALDVLRLAKAGMSGSVDLAAQISILGALALAFTRIGRNSDGYDAAVKTMNLLDKMSRPSSHSVIVGISSVLEVLLRGREAGLSEDYEEWRNLEKSALSKLERYSEVFPVGRAQLGMWRGKRNWLDGKRDVAISEWSKGRKWAKTHHLRKDAALIEAEIRRWQTT